MTDKQFEQPPAGTTPAPAPTSLQARIFAMPERYRHGAEGKMHHPAAPAPAAAPAVKAPSAPAAPSAPPPPKPALAKKPSSSHKKLLTGGVVFVVLLAVSGFVAMRFVGQEPAKVATTPTPTTRPAPVREPEPDVPSETPATSVTSETTEPFATRVSPGTDSDSDGLTDVEEENVYRTNPRLPDTDADGFLDGNEVFHRYNPGGTAPLTLLESGLVTSQVVSPSVTPETSVTAATSLEFYYPTAWTLDQDGNGYRLDAKTGEGIKISFEPKEVLTSIDGATASTSKNGLPYLQSEDKLKAFIDLGDRVMVFTYDPGTRGRVEYLQTMQMMVNSVRL